MMTDITIYTSANNGEEILVLPIVPKNLPEIIEGYNHAEFATNSDDLTIIGRRKRKTMSLEFLLPVYKNYRSINNRANRNGKDYIDFWEKWSNREVPMRLVITKADKEILNIAYTINSLNYKYDRKFDIIATLEIAEYIFTFDEKTEEEENKEYKWTSVRVTYSTKYKSGGVFNYTMSITGANVEGHWLVGVRQLLELLGYKVTWNANEKAIYMEKDGNNYKLTSGFEIYEGTSYGYLYEICDELGYKTEWISESKEVIIHELL